MVKKRTSQSGVTLIELIVVVAIFAVVSSVLLFNFSDFSTNVSVRNLAQDVALSIRKAQSLATSVRSINTSGVQSDQYKSYGVSFSVGNTVNLNDLEPDPKQFVIFADVGVTVDKLYNAGSNCSSPSVGDECAESFSINSADRITKICTNNNSNCFTNGTANIVFRRPTPDAEFCIVTGNSCDPTNVSNVDITITSAKGAERIVSVWNTGQISVK